ncbi:hypothetical protein ACFORG_20840 [Lutimaribacter marinistellae]|uniref:Peptidase M23 n=1 Tax=Lutimaribacter marinistellae TaxID=1820329 RepID=A0ABV7TQE0_9RHOB
MTRYILPALIVTAGPALAHPGVHLHPHGAGDWMTVAIGLAFTALAVFLVVRR